MKKNLIHEIRAFENYTIEGYEKGSVQVSTKVAPSSLNYYGNAHGGYLFTLCDQVAGITALTTGVSAVTQQASISYFKAGHLEDTLRIEGTCLHDGRMTKVVEVCIFNQQKQLIAKATYNMFVTGEMKATDMEEILETAIL